MISGAEFRFTECPIDSKKKKLKLKLVAAKLKYLVKLIKVPTVRPGFTTVICSSMIQSDHSFPQLDNNFLSKFAR